MGIVSPLSPRGEGSKHSLLPAPPSSIPGGPMMTDCYADPLRHELERRVQTRTSRRVRNLCVELTPERVVLRGQATSYYVKQLAFHGIRELLPRASVDNDIAVFAPAGVA